MDISVIDKDGEWLKTVAPLGMRDPYAKDGVGVVFQHGVAVRVKRTAWMQTQIDAGNIVQVEDPFAADEPAPAPAPAPAPSPSPAPAAAK